MHLLILKKRESVNGDDLFESILTSVDQLVLIIPIPHESLITLVNILSNYITISALILTDI